MSNKKTQEKQHKRSFFQRVFPCFAKSLADADEIMLQRFGHDYKEYEFVIENLAVRRAPKALLDEADGKIIKSKSKIGKTSKVKESPKVKRAASPLPTSSSIIEGSGDAAEDDDISSNFFYGMGSTSPRKKQLVPNTMKFDPCYLHLYPDKNTCQGCKQGYNKTKDDHKEIMKRMLLPPLAVNKTPPKLKFEVSKSFPLTSSPPPKKEKVVHQIPASPSEVSLKDVPADLQKTIAALKVARPHHCPIFPPKKNKIKRSSNDSCEKDTSCNIFDADEFENQFDISLTSLNDCRIETETRVVSPKTTKELASPRTKGVNSSRIGSNPGRSAVETKLQNKKWKIIINKHANENV